VESGARSTGKNDTFALHRGIGRLELEDERLGEWLRLKEVKKRKS
jgi:hypothetical protein